jgi:hypothetical protein
LTIARWSSPQLFDEDDEEEDVDDAVGDFDDDTFLLSLLLVEDSNLNGTVPFKIFKFRLL